MTDLQKKKAPRPAVTPSYREIQLAILAELRLHTELLTTLCQHQDDAAIRQDRGIGPATPRRKAKPINVIAAHPSEYNPSTATLSLKE